MADFNNMREAVQRRADVSVDQGLRSYMLGVYNLMAVGLVITALAALGVATLASNNPQMMQAIYVSPLKYVIVFSPLIAVLFLSMGIQKMSTNGARLLFIVYAALMGLSISSIFFMFTKQSIVQVFFITAASFGALSLWGYTTKRDLRPMGTFLFIGLFGLILASLVNLFMQSSGFNYFISVVGVFLFAGLTAYDTQTIKELYFEGDSSDTMGRKIIMGALTLYLDFINMFMMLLQLLGNRDSN